MAWSDEIVSSTYPVRVEFEPEHEALATAVLGSAERAWQREIVELGYPPPFTRGDPPKVGMLFEIKSTGLGAGAGMAHWEDDVASTPNSDCSGIVVIDSATLPDDEGLDETVFHELNHTTQYATDCTEPPSAYEGFTIAAVRDEFPDSDIVPWVIEQFQQFPEYPLDYWTMTFPCSGSQPCFPYQLGAALFPMYLMDRYGQSEPEVLVDIFGRFAQDGSTIISPPHPHCTMPNHPNWFEGVEAFLLEHGVTFADAFCEFSAWRAIVGEYDDGGHFSRGDEIAPPRVSASIAPTDATLPFEVHEYGSRYIEVNADPALPSNGWRVSVSANPGAIWCGSVLNWHQDGSVTREPLVFEGGQGRGELADLAQVSRTLLVVSQQQDDSHVPDDKNYAQVRSFSIGFEREEVDSGVPEAGQDALVDTETDAAEGSVDATMDPDARPSEENASCDCRMGVPRRSEGVPLALLLAVSLMLRRTRLR